MITVFYCTKEDMPEHIEHITKTSGVKDIEVIQYINNGEGLTIPYNKALETAKHKIVVFLHNDIEIMTKNWGRKLMNHYKRNPEYGILGVAGTKFMPKSGRWWDKRQHMHGQVYHTHQGRTWLSKYSEHLGNKITESIIVDGVFFSVHKDRIKEKFNLDVKGFHFYDVDFTFRNHISGVKVGVHFDIKINHMSIGETDEEWEKNREVFAEEFKDTLPMRIEENFEKRRMKLLVGCLNFQGLTGSEISTLETVKALSKTCDVTVVAATVSDKFKNICDRHGVKTHLMTEPPGYKMGDGKWGFNTPEGFQPTKDKMLYKVEDIKFDLIHANHTPITTQLLNLYPDGDFVNIVRSEVIGLEKPVIDERIHRYIAIRPSIKDYLIKDFDIPADKIDVVYNAFDGKRFNVGDKESGTDKEIVLFVGTMDYLRENPINDLVSKTKDENRELWLVGKDTNGYATELANENEHVRYFPPTEKIEDFYQMCTETAGVFLGRTTIEGFLCGKPAIIYTVDETGNIIDSEFQAVPEDMSVFSLDKHVENTKNVYIKAYNAL